MQITIGSPAPLFTLKNTEKQDISLETQKGKNILLLFFPLAFTSTCTIELCSVRDNMQIYNDLNAEVFGISVDSHFTLAEYKKQQKINFDLLSDFNKNVSTDYGVLYEDFYGLKGVSKRASFIIDANGIIRYAEVLEKASDLPDFASIRSTLEKLNEKMV